MSEKKILTVNPEIFGFSNKTTRKKKETLNNKIKIKPQLKHPEKNTLKKRSILRMIRQQQNEKYEEMLEKNNIMDKKIKNDLGSNLNSEYKKAENYLKHLSEKVNTNNTTLKNNKAYTNYGSMANYATENNIETVNNIKVNNSDTISLNNQPKYGCLKNGSLPTYKSYMNNTRKNLPIHQPLQQPQLSQQIQVAQPLQVAQPTHIANSLPVNQNPNINIMNDSNNNKINNYLNNSISTKPSFNINNNLLKEHKTKCKKRKKILRRTYKVGKNKALNKISILVSNKSIRNNTTTNKQLYKQVPIDEIKIYLIKHGFIKIGTICPPNLMRKMYETALLMCGEIKNHNPENLLYNFINNSDDV